MQHKVWFLPLNVSYQTYFNHFMDEINQMESNGWVIDMRGIAVFGEEENRAGHLRIACDMYSPNDVRTPWLRSIRLDLQGVVQS